MLRIRSIHLKLAIVAALLCTWLTPWFPASLIQSTANAQSRHSGKGIIQQVATANSTSDTTPSNLERGGVMQSADAENVEIAGGPLFFNLAGRVTDVTGEPIADVTISTNNGKQTVTDPDGHYEFRQLKQATYTLIPAKENLPFDPASLTIRHDIDRTDVDFTLDLPPVLLVHGIRILSFDYSCNDGLELFQNAQKPILSEIPVWLRQRSFPVWFTHLDSNPLYTPILEANAECLYKQIEAAYEQSNRTKLVVIAHNMGGPVVRACLSLPDCRSKVEAVYTLGSPHGGINADTIAMLYGPPEAVCRLRPVICQLASNEVVNFNSANPNQQDIDYIFIGGDNTPAGAGWVLRPTEGKNDGVVGRQSSVGWVRPLQLSVPDWTGASYPEQFWTDEVHTSGFNGNAYAESRDGDVSQAFECILHHMGYGPRPSFCRRPSSRGLPETIADTVGPQLSAFLTGGIRSGVIISRSLIIDPGEHVDISLVWQQGNVRFSLVQPDGQALTPEPPSPLGVVYTSNTGSPASPPMATYSICDPLPGAWILNIEGIDPASDRAYYSAFAQVLSDLALTVESASRFAVGETAYFTASLTMSPTTAISATVHADLVLPSIWVKTVSFEPIGPGTYRGQFTVPEVGGRVFMRVIARGDDPVRPFSRQRNVIWSITPEDAAFTGTPVDRGRDLNGDGLYSALEVDVPLDFKEPGTYRLSANLTAGTEQIASTAIGVAVDKAGVERVQLAFDGDIIADSGKDGPYQIVDGVVTSLTLGSIPVATSDEVHITMPYRAGDFSEDESFRVYLPLTVR